MGDACPPHPRLVRYRTGSSMVRPLHKYMGERPSHPLSFPNPGGSGQASCRDCNWEPDVVPFQHSISGEDVSPREERVLLSELQALQRSPEAILPGAWKKHFLCCCPASSKNNAEKMLFSAGETEGCGDYRLWRGQLRAACLSRWSRHHAATQPSQGPWNS